MQASRPDRRPFIVSRSGWAGVQRYAWNWTGDVASTWPALRQTVATVLGLGLSGVPFTGSDIGGFGGVPTAELYLRWLQCAAFFPFSRTHSAKFTPRREPWQFGEPYLGLARAALNLRYRLMPDLYTLAWEASQSGCPLVRPLFWREPHDSDLWDVEDAFLLGDALLVAPVPASACHAREVVLPAGTWCEFPRDQLRVWWSSEGAFAFPYASVRVQLHGLQIRHATLDGMDTVSSNNSIVAGRFAELRIDAEDGYS